MVIRRWIWALAAAAGIAVIVGAAQLGLGYGLSIISWLPGGIVLSDTAWGASLTWATWIAATSTIAGAITADRLSGAPASTPEVGDQVAVMLWRLALSFAASFGAMLTVVLVAVPARAVEFAGTVSPHIVAAEHTALGVLVGLVLAVIALSTRAAAANVIATSAWLWLFAAVAVAQGLTVGGVLVRVPLAFWDFATSEQSFRNILLVDAAPVLGAALVVGALAALPAARRGDSPAGVATSGVVGPLILAIAYLLTQPSLVGASAQELSRHLVMPYVVVAGLMGSLLISSIARPRAPQSAWSSAGTATLPASSGKTADSPMLSSPSDLPIPGPRPAPKKSSWSKQAGKDITISKSKASPTSRGASASSTGG